MLAAEVRKRVEDEIGDDWTQSNLHGVDLQRCLLRDPVLTTCVNSFCDSAKPEDKDNEPQLILWLVLEEDPVTKKGYQIVYNERTDLFGLAIGGTFLGFHGNFIATLMGM